MATRIFPIVKQHHLFLSTILLSNAITLETLPIFLDRLVPSWAAILISTIAVVVFSEIIPQAICTGPNQIPIASYLAPFMTFLLNTIGVACMPLSWVLDKVLGEHAGTTRYVRKDLSTLVQLHENTVKIPAKSGEPHKVSVVSRGMVSARKKSK